MKDITHIIEKCYNPAWYDGPANDIDGGEPSCPCCAHIDTDDDFGEYVCAANTTLEPSCKEIPKECPLEDAE